MRISTKIFLILLLFLTFGSAIAQKSKLYLQPGRLYSKGTVYMNNPQKSISVNRLILIDNTTLNYSDPETGLPASLDVVNSSVDYVRIKTGTRSGEFGFAGAGIGLLYSLVSLPENDSEKTYDRIMGYTIGGLAAGGLIGLFVPKHKVFFILNRNSANKPFISPIFGKGGQEALGISITF